MSAILLEKRPEPKTDETGCLHPAFEVLGTDGNTTFLRCHLCDRLVIVQGGRAWVLRPRLTPPP